MDSAKYAKKKTKQRKIFKIFFSTPTRWEYSKLMVMLFIKPSSKILKFITLRKRSEALNQDKFGHIVKMCKTR